MNVRGRLAGALASVALLATACASGAQSSERPRDMAAEVAKRMTGRSASPAGSAGAVPGEYLVFYTEGQRTAAMRAVAAAGGVYLGQDERLGYLVVSGVDPERMGDESEIAGITADKVIGTAVEPDAATPPASVRARAGTSEPLAGRQWDMRMIGATAKGSYAHATGSHKVLVGIIDTGVDGTHPDIAPNFNRELSRNFVTDRPSDPNGRRLDGPCEQKDCKDPVDADDDGHGTHVASTIGAPRNGLGTAGVAPDVSLVNLRAGTDSGYFFLKPTLQALTYAADAGVDVVNMSFFVDPWTFNCTDNPKDSVAERLEQRAILVGMRRAVDYARKRGVTLITAIGNSGSDLGKVTKDTASPNFPIGSERERTIENDSCLNVPAELDGVISVASVGPSGRKSSFSDYGVEQTDLAAPGGDSDDAGTAIKGTQRQILAAAPEKALRAKGLLDANGKPRDSSVVRDCGGGVCAYYQYMEGTSMASPHAAGVAAIIIGRFGKPGKGGLTMDPAEVERLLYASATRRSCPSPRAFRYSATEVQMCEGDKSDNGFYGHGVVDAEKAATMRR